MTSPANLTKAPAAVIGTVVLFSLFPILSLLSSNIGQVDVLSSARSAAAVVLGALLVTGIAWLALHDWPRATLLTAGLLLLFFSYGHVYDMVRRVEIGGVLVGRHRYLAPLWGVASLAWLWLVPRIRARVSLRWLLAFSALLVLVPLTSLGAAAARTALAARSSPAPDAAGISTPANEELPDIYYIILDAYGREDVLADLYGIDTHAFVEALRARGFYVADQARSNYSHTLQSLASSLNMRYLDDLAAQMGPDTAERAPLEQMVKHSEVRQILEGLGYQTIAFESGYSDTEIRDADFYFAPHYDELDLTPTAVSTMPINEFEGLLAKTTALRPLLDEVEHRQDLAVRLLSLPYQEHRARVIYTLGTVAVGAQLDGPQFVFAHVVCPHVPFVFNKPGEELIPRGTFTLRDDAFMERADYIEGYRWQVQALNLLVLQAIDEILATSDPEPVIILQSDHGPAAYMDLEDELKSDMHERLGILNAYYLPGEGESLLYPSITPVNSFGVVLQMVFGHSVERLPDESYFAPYWHPYAFTRVTEAAIGP